MNVDGIAMRLLWFIITADDTKSFVVQCYALDKATGERKAPPAPFRFETVAKSSVAAT